MKNEERIEKIKVFFNCEKDVDLARLLRIHRSQIHRWRTEGFAASTAKIIDILIEFSQIALDETG